MATSKQNRAATAANIGTEIARANPYARSVVGLVPVIRERISGAFPGLDEFERDALVGVAISAARSELGSGL